MLGDDVALPLVLGGKARRAAGPVEDADQRTSVFGLDVLLEGGKVAEGDVAVDALQAGGGAGGVFCGSRRRRRRGTRRAGSQGLDFGSRAVRGAAGLALGLGDGTSAGFG